MWLLGIEKADGKTIWVNPEHVVAIDVDAYANQPENTCVLYLSGWSCGINVNSDPDELAQKITSAELCG